MLIHLLFQGILIILAGVALLTIGPSTLEMVITGTIYVILSLLFSALADTLVNKRKSKKSLNRD